MFSEQFLAKSGAAAMPQAVKARSAFVRPPAPLKRAGQCGY
ncbi:hypothetical protein HMPREF0262_00258 [Clostridium sp. ATCC 29733]|nr:hypothetical protein HMPREF0262_00258 [Clostridium sp. ATCC 29733]